MSVEPSLPDDLEQCQRLLHDLLRRNDELRRQAEDARRQAEDARRRTAEIERVLEATTADYGQLQQQHAELAETLALLRRYIFGPRRERLVDDPDQGHLFGLHDPAIELEADATARPDASSPGRQPKTATQRRRQSLDHLPQVRIEHDLPDHEKTCPCC